MLQANANTTVTKLAGSWMYAENHKFYGLLMLSKRKLKELNWRVNYRRKTFLCSYHCGLRKT